VSLLTRARKTPFVGAGADNCIAYSRISPETSVRLAGTVIAGRLEPPPPDTTTDAVVVPKLEALAVIVAEPGATLFTGRLAEVRPAGIFTTLDTAATEELLDEILTSTPPVGAGAERTSVRFCVLAGGIAILAGIKLREPAPELPVPTCTCIVAVV
jgi:hypothetical protein